MKRFLASMTAFLAAGAAPLLAADTAATVTEAVNEVSHGSAQSGESTPAKTGTHLQDGEYLKTGVKSRAELQLANQSVTRLGANTIFNYSATDNVVDLQSGTILFSKPKDGNQMSIKTASVTAAIVGTSGFCYVQAKVFLFGLIEGHAKLNVGGVLYKLSSGEILQIPKGGTPQIFSYNVPVFVATSPLLTEFHAPLPNQPYVDREVRKYKDDAARGFYGPATPPYFASTLVGEVPTLPIPAHDSAGNSLDRFNEDRLNNRPYVPPPIQPPMPPPQFNGNGFDGGFNGG